MHYRTSVTEEVIGDFRFRLSCIESFDNAVDQICVELEEKGNREQLEALCPYFGILWPGSRVLARWLWQQGPETVRGKKVLELGCGLALPSFVAARMGAHVIASDLHPHVPLFLAKNMNDNPGSPIRFRRLDWAKAEDSGKDYDWILASDVLYERHQAATLASFVDRKLSARGQAVILDPNRSFWERLVESARKLGLQTSVSHLPPSTKDDPQSSILIRITRYNIE